MKKDRLLGLSEWQNLKNHFKEISKLDLSRLFSNDNERGENFSIYEDGIYFDYSKNLITDETLDLLINLADRSGLNSEIRRMFSGENINVTEERPALHVALRDFSSRSMFVNRIDVRKSVSETLKRMKEFSNKIISGEWRGGTGKRIKNIVNIGIGGSFLGPLVTVNSLKKYSENGIGIYFISNIDLLNFKLVLEQMDPEETVFLIVSKSFSTSETILNTGLAVEWVKEKIKKSEIYKKHFIAITSKKEKAIEFGIYKENILDIGEWIGGRYSVSSAANLSLMISIGPDNYDQFLKGLNSMDLHFKEKPFKKNIPVLLALIGIWNRNFFHRNVQSIIPYGEELRHFTQYLQQLEMESNGKSVDVNGECISYETSPVIFGDRGVNAQHSFFQLLHQGTDIIPVDLIGFAKTSSGADKLHDMLIANMIAQSETLAFGINEGTLKREGRDERLIPHLVCKGNRPSNMIILDELSPYLLGKLISIYEHRTFIQGVIWNIDSFDQWGVELGKKLSEKIFSELDSGNLNKNNHDSSTNRIIEHFLILRNQD